MSFIPIDLDSYIRLHLRSNPSENEKVLRIKLESALEAFKNGDKCNCGNDIWIVGSAYDGFKCFQCITGKNHPTGEYEIETAINKVDKFGRRHIDEIDPRKINGIFNDDGYEIKTDQFKKPALCMSCLRNYDPGPEDDIMCNLTRNDQRNKKNFICYEYEKL